MGSGSPLKNQSMHEEKLKKIQGLVKEKKIVFAPQDKLRPLQPWLDELRKVLRIKSWWISNESTIGDFGLNDEGLQNLCDELGVEVEHKNYLVDVAQRMKDHESLDSTC